MRTPPIRRVVSIKQTTVTLGVLLFAIFIGIVLILAAKASPIADDYLFLHPDSSTISLVYNQINGRLSQGIAIALSYTLFKESAVNVLPIIIVLSFMSAISFIFFRIFKSKYALLSGAVISILIMTSFHSFFDFSLFLSATTTHTLTLIYVLLIAGLLITLHGSNYQIKPYYYVPLVLACLFGSTLSELAAVLSCVLVLSSMAMRRGIKHWTATQFPLHLAVMVSNIVGFLIIYFSPGSVSRRLSSPDTQAIDIIIKGTFSDYIDLVMHFITSPSNILALLCAGGILYLLVNRTIKLRQDWYMIDAILLLYVIPVLIFVMTNYSLGYTAMRMFNIADTSFFLASALLLAYTGLIIKDRYGLSARPTFLLPICVTLCTIVVGNFATETARDIYTAQVSRQELLKYRINRITSDLQSSNESLSFMPAPLLLVNTEAIDMTFYPKESPQSMWMYEGLLKYYGIQNSKDVIIMEQPKNYCINTNIFSRFHEVLAKACGTY